MRLLVTLLMIFASVADARNVADDQFKTLSQAKQKEMLGKIVRGVGEKCPIVKVLFLAGRDKQDNAFYSVRCNNGEDFSIQIKSDTGGSTVVTDCAVLKLVRINCWKAL